MTGSLLFVALVLGFFVALGLGARPRHERLPVRVVLRTGVLRLALQGVVRLTDLTDRARPDVENRPSAPSPG
jgi:hypothetical protein